MREKRGVYIHGDPAYNNLLLMWTARALALGNGSVHFVSLGHLVGVVEAAGDKYGQLSRVRHLFVESFEVTRPPECPFTPYERNLVQRFLIARQRVGLNNHFAASPAFDDLKWWSDDFVGELKQVTIPFKV